MKHLTLALLTLPLLAQAAPIATAPVEYRNVEATWSSLGVAEPSASPRSAPRLPAASSRSTSAPGTACSRGR